MNIASSPLIRKLIALALEEDLAFGDVTSTITVASGHRSTGTIIAREALIVCGLEIVPMICAEFGSALEFETLLPDGSVAVVNDPIAVLSGETRALLSLERTILNFIQRTSGIATSTRKVVENSSGITVLDTRKTTPGWRILEKYAVTVGGGKNHRASLGDMILIKNNHIDAHNGDIEAVFKAIEARKPPYMPIECEVRTLDELNRVLQFDVDCIILDNMANDEISRCLALIKQKQPRCKVEVSGRITAERLKELSSLGVQYVSMGALTNRAHSVDISLRITQQ